MVTGKHRRLTLLEVPNEINAMIDAAKIADLVLFMIDASCGLEMEHFEFISICQAHGVPKFMPVLTHMDVIKNKTQLREKQKLIKHRLWKELYPGAKLFLLTTLIHESYPYKQVQNLARFISGKIICSRIVELHLCTGNTNR